MKKGQIWVETVIYTLIGLSLIALVLTIVTPKINEAKDRAVIEQSIKSLKKISLKIEEVSQAPGNVRNVEFSMKRGSLIFNMSDDLIFFEIDDSSTIYSEPGAEIPIIGKINVTTTEGLKEHKISLKLDVRQDLQFDEGGLLLSGGKKTINYAKTPYKFIIKNEGIDPTCTVSCKLRIVFSIG
ncbi:TPA: hypothetical protein EYQ19_02530 [Candidatus Pacearchaeota archaeon]|nr:hypothetical protein [Candidatus Pacearchaeota archaeon]